jgi:hypothetical protein|tara:strand:+ start:5485 stop:5700 length:216 start_codon:yes stop_codon:yes gene_type:complete
MKYIIGFWTLIPYSYDENLFTNEGDINILQAVVIDSEEIEPIDNDIILSLPEKEWFKFNNGFVGQNRRLNN